MKKTLIPFAQVAQLAKTDIAYATGDPLLQPFYEHQPVLASFDAIIAKKSAHDYPRKDLADLLEEQYKSLPNTGKVLDNIAALRLESTFTITTAHQPSLFLGPLYFIYKALTAINLAKAVEAKMGGKNRIVPVFVLGSEDHDLEELNKANLFGKKVLWEPGLTGPVGSMPAATVAPALEELQSILGDSPSAKALFERVERAYSGEKNFAEATQALLHEFMGNFGLVVINMGSPLLKRHFIPFMRQELFDQSSFRIVNETIAELQKAGFKTQAAPREINLFYLQPGSRERIVHVDGVFKVLNTELVFSAEAMEAELNTHPERFSPNVLMRPIFQEIILPNLAYVGGGGELAYWLERKAQFEHFGVPFPMLVRRHSVLWLDKDAEKKLEKFGFSAPAFFDDTDKLIREYIEKNAAGEVSLAAEVEDLRTLYNKLCEKASLVDPTLEKSLRAEEVKAISGVQQWESRLIRAEKQKHEVTINQINGLKEKLFPGNGLQERTDNILPLLLKYGDAFLSELLTVYEPFDPGFLVLQSDDNQ